MKKEVSKVENVRGEVWSYKFQTYYFWNYLKQNYIEREEKRADVRTHLRKSTFKYWIEKEKPAKKTKATCL